ncbi:MAG: AAA family ATPase [bacterium]
MFKRQIEKTLAKWARSPRRKPLILRGARQVGKTTAVKLFSKNFDQYIYLNLDLEADRLIFEKGYSIADLLNAIRLEKNAPTISGRTLIFIDEIQNSPNAVHLLRYFYEFNPELYIIAAGSLLESAINIQDSFPVGRVEYAYLYPVNFNEFLSASGENELLSLLKTIPLAVITHEKLLRLFHRYTLIGGLPEIVDSYLKSEDISTLGILYEGLKNSYNDDFEKYAKSQKEKQILRHIINSVPQYAGKRIKYQGFGNSSYRSKDIAEGLRTLEKAFLIELNFPTTSCDLPVILNRQKAPKLHFFDTGLMIQLLGLQTALLDLSDLNNVYLGLITEHVVAQELKSISNSVRNTANFWTRESNQANAEVDFVIQHKNLLIPIEVKSGATGTLRSLHEYVDRAPHSYAVRLYAGEIRQDEVSTRTGKKFQLLSLPYYLAGHIHEYLEWFCK